MSLIVTGWRCHDCGGKVRVTDAREKVPVKVMKRRRDYTGIRTRTKEVSRNKKDFVFIYCNYTPCTNHPSKGGGEQMETKNFERGFRPNWVDKIEGDKP